MDGASGPTRETQGEDVPGQSGPGSIRVYQFSSQGFGQDFAAAGGRPSVFARAAMLAIAAVLLIALAVIVIPLVVVALIVFALAAVYFLIVGWIKTLGRGGGDGRRNVRVIERP